MESLVKTVLDSMSISKPQKKFIALLLTALVVVQGKANFRNMSRYSVMSEKRFSRWYRHTFNFYEFNTRLIFGELNKSHQCIAAIDASFMRKSGKHTEGLGMFYSGASKKAERGLEVSLISIIDLQSHTAYGLNAWQTLDQQGKTRVELYAEQVVSVAPDLLNRGIKHLVSDAFYTKYKFVTPVVRAGLHIVGKMRVDADLCWLYSGVYSGVGRPKKYDGKVHFDQDLSRFQFSGSLTENTDVYSEVVYSKSLKRKVRVVLLRIRTDQKTGRAVLFSTDIHSDAMTVVSYYKARFQIEFVFRDAKQYTGLMDCQSRKKEAINTHLNASLSALNLLKLEDRREKNTEEQTVISMASWKRRKFNEHLMNRVFERLGLSLNEKKVMDTYEQLSLYGVIAA